MLWQGRFRACPVRHEAYLLACYRYIEPNPGRAKMAERPGAHPWSSYHANARGKTDALVTPHAGYRASDRAASRRRAAYRAPARKRLPAEPVDGLRRATNGNFAFGDERFQTEVAAKRGRHVTPGRPGRPRKATA